MGKLSATSVAVGVIVALIVIGCSTTETSPTSGRASKPPPPAASGATATPQPAPTASPTARAVLLFPTATPVPTSTATATAKPMVEDEYFVQILRVLDGDTVEVEIEAVQVMGLRTQTIRIEGVDTPETRTSNEFEKACGNLSKERVIEFLSDPGQYVLLTEFEDGGFGRKLGDIRSPSGRYLTEFLLVEGLAVEYDASTPKDFEDHRKNCEALVEAGFIARPDVDERLAVADEPTATGSVVPDNDGAPIATSEVEATIELSVTYKTCEEAEEAGLERVKGLKGDGRGFPVNLMDGPRDGDGDGVVCER